QDLLQPALRRERALASRLGLGVPRGHGGARGAVGRGATGAGPEPLRDAHRLHGRGAGGRGRRHRGRRRHGAAPARQRLAARLTDWMTEFVEGYLLLGLRLGKLIPGLVDAYYGPPELSAQVDGEEPCEPAALAAEAQALLAGLDVALDGEQRARRLRSHPPRLATTPH